MHGLRRDGALRAFFVDHDADDLHVVGRVEFFQNFFGVGHLRYGFRRDEGYRVDMLEPGADQGLQIGALDVGGIWPFSPCQASRGHSISLTTSDISFHHGDTEAQRNQEL